jgi:glycosyltransferase involved in cell wall biosynthesis
MTLVSIIINNYNYGRFLREAIESALAQSYAFREVIVVDDGSTDDSPDIVRSYGDRIQSILKENGGQASAMNRGCEIAKGEVVFFLDSDDKLHARAVKTVMAAWNSRYAKAHFRLDVLDVGNVHQGCFPEPHAKLPEGDLAEEILNNGFYVCPPCSGNAFSSWALKEILPIPEAPFRYCADVYLNYRVPFLGPVLAIDQALGVYRVHGTNGWFGVTMAEDIERLRGRIELTETFRRVPLEEAIRRGRPDAALHWPLDTTLQRLKIICRRLDPSPAAKKGETVWQLGGALLQHAWTRPHLLWKERLSNSAFAIVFMLSPRWLLESARRTLPRLKRRKKSPLSVDAGGVKVGGPI